ncbi:MAG: hypothetical protein ACLS36_09070 [Streptococcus sp.]
MTNMERDESIMKFARQLRGMELMKRFVNVVLRWRSFVLGTSNLSLWIDVERLLQVPSA